MPIANTTAPWLAPRYWRRPVARHRRLLVAGLLAAAVAAGLRALAPSPAPTVPVTVAARDLPAGAVLSIGDVQAVRWPRRTVPAGTVTAVVGRRLAGAVRQGEPITDVRLRGAAVLAGQDPSARAVAVRLATPTAGLVRPGDRVDVVAVWPGDVVTLGTKVIARDALVLAGPAQDEGSSPGGQGPASGLTSPLTSSDPGTTGELLVLAVGPSTAVDLAGASVSASLSVVLRGLS